MDLDDQSLQVFPSSSSAGITYDFTDESTSSVPAQVRDIAQLHDSGGSSQSSPIGSPLGSPMGSMTMITGRHSRRAPRFGPPNMPEARRPGRGHRVPHPAHQPTFVDDLPVRAVSSPRDLPPVHYHDATGSPGSPDVDNPPSPEGKYNGH